MDIIINVYTSAITITRVIKNIERPIEAINNLQSNEILSLIEQKKEEYKKFNITVIYNVDI